MAMGSEDAGACRPCAVGDTSKWRSRHHYNIGGELAIVETVAAIEQNGRWIKERLSTEPKTVDR